MDKRTKYFAYIYEELWKDLEPVAMKKNVSLSADYYRGRELCARFRDEDMSVCGKISILERDIFGTELLVSFLQLSRMALIAKEGEENEKS